MELLLNQETFQSENFFSFSLTVQIYIFPHHQICFFFSNILKHLSLHHKCTSNIFNKYIFQNISQCIFSIQQILISKYFEYVVYTYLYITARKKYLKKKRRGDAAAIKPLTVKQSVEGGIGKTLCPENHYLTFFYFQEKNVMPRKP